MTLANARQLADQAWTLVESRRLIEAREIFMRVCELDPNDAEAWMMRGSIHGELGELDPAMDCLQRALTIDPAYADAYFTFSKILLQQDRIEAALGLCLQAVTHDPDFAEAWIFLAGLRGQLGQYAEAEECSRKAVALSPDNAQAHANLANALRTLGRTEQAVSSYQRALQLNPQLTDLWFQLGRACMQLNKINDAVECFQQVTTLAPAHVDGHVRLAGALLELRRLEEAETACRGALRLMPQSVEAHTVLGDILQWQNRLDEAAASFHQALNIRPDFIGAMVNLAYTLQRQKKFKEAAACYEKVLEINPSYAEARLDLGNVYRKLGLLDKADTQFHLLQEDQDAAILKTASPDYVARLFDEYADRFDRHLVEELGYQIPQSLDRAVRELINPAMASLDILDLGCGTGLCGPLFRDLAKKITGVDLSPRMIEKAKSRNVYDELHVADITTFLSTTNALYDLILAADVFVYIGDLSLVFKNCKTALKPGGLFVFSVATTTEKGRSFTLETSGRYAQSTEYIMELAVINGLQLAKSEPAVIRKEKNNPVPGYIFLLRRP